VSGVNRELDSIDLGELDGVTGGGALGWAVKGARRLYQWATKTPARKFATGAAAGTAIEEADKRLSK